MGPLLNDHTASKCAQTQPSRLFKGFHTKGPVVQLTSPVLGGTVLVDVSSACDIAYTLRVYMAQFKVEWGRRPTSRFHTCTLQSAPFSCFHELRVIKVEQWNGERTDIRLRPHLSSLTNACLQDAVAVQGKDIEKELCKFPSWQVALGLFVLIYCHSQHMHTHTHSNIHPQARAHTHTHTDTLTHRHSHTRTHTHVQTKSGGMQRRAKRRSLM